MVNYKHPYVTMLKTDNLDTTYLVIFSVREEELCLASKVTRLVGDNDYEGDIT